jgi:hypothetical protein
MSVMLAAAALMTRQGSRARVLLPCVAHLAAARSAAEAHTLPPHAAVLRLQSTRNFSISSPVSYNGRGGGGINQYAPTRTPPNYGVRCGLLPGVSQRAVAQHAALCVVDMMPSLMNYTV